MIAANLFLKVLLGLSISSIGISGVYLISRETKKSFSDNQRNDDNSDTGQSSEER